MLSLFLAYVHALVSTCFLLWRFRRVLWHGKAYFEADVARNGPEFKRALINSGPFFMKLGQWLSQRPDLLPRPFLLHLKALQYDAPSHAFKDTLAALRRALEDKNGNIQSVEDAFAHIEPKAMASGSIAQVHRATLREDGVQCVIKVRHPGVLERLQDDLRYVRTLFKIGRALGLQVCRVVDVESMISEMLAQCALRHEVRAMCEFRENFRDSTNLHFPEPIAWCQSDEVIVETLVHGVRYDQLVDVDDAGLDLCKRMTMGAFLHMVLLDGVVHGDCHGGNVLYRVTPRANPETLLAGTCVGGGTGESERGAIGLQTQDMYQGARPPEVFNVRAQVSFVDFGITIRLTPVQRRAFVDLMCGVLAQDAARCVTTIRHLVVTYAGGSDDDLNTEQLRALQSFETDFAVVLQALDDKSGDSSISNALRQMLYLLQRHELRIDGNLVRIIVNFILIEEDYGYAKFNNLFDNTLLYVLYNDEDHDFDELIESFSDLFGNHYAVRHGSRAPPPRTVVGTDDSSPSLQHLRLQSSAFSSCGRRRRRRRTTASTPANTIVTSSPGTVSAAANDDTAPVALFAS